MMPMNNSHNPFEGWTTIEDAARIIGRSKAIISQWANKGFITSHTVGQKMRVVNIEEVQAYAATRKPYKKKALDKTRNSG
jgi:hypothetical protein